MISATSPNQQGVAGTDSEDVWMITEESAILVISTSLLGTLLFFLIKEAYFQARSLLLTSRCAIRGPDGMSDFGVDKIPVRSFQSHLFVDDLAAIQVIDRTQRKGVDFIVRQEAHVDDLKPGSMQTKGSHGSI